MTKSQGRKLQNFSTILLHKVYQFIKNTEL